ncbi:hypothetical protein BGW38_006040, partial [Lunasporangiospora selenospora]
SKTRHLQEIESTEQDMASSLQKQLDHVRETAASLKAAAEASANTTNTKDSPPSTQVTGNPEEMRRALSEALDKQKQQEALVKKLRHELDVERGHVTILRHDNQVLKQMKANMHAAAEQEEENISNRLLKRISGLKKEKGELMLQVEQEEEYLTKTLQKKLSQLQKEKIDIENALEQEQEYIVNRLQKQLDAMRMEQSASTSAASSWQDKDHSISSSLPIGSSPINIAGGGRHSRMNPNPSPTPSPTHKKWIPSHSPSSSDHGPSHPLIDMLKAELAGTKASLNELEREYMVKFKQCNRYRSEVLSLRQEFALPVASDLLVEDTLPIVLSSAYRTGGTPSRRNSSTSVSGSSALRSYGVPATPTNTPANPAPINTHHFIPHRASLSPHTPQTNPFSGHGPAALGQFSTSPTLAVFPGGISGHHVGNGSSSGHFSTSGVPSGGTLSHGPYSSGNSGTASFSSSVGSLGSTSPMMSMSSSVSSSSGLPAIVPERNSLYRSKSSGRQHSQYMAPPLSSVHHTLHQQHHSLQGSSAKEILNAQAQAQATSQNASQSQTAPSALLQKGTSQ